MGRGMEWKWRRGLSFRLVDKLLRKSADGNSALKMLALIFWKERTFIFGRGIGKKVWKGKFALQNAL